MRAEDCQAIYTLNPIRRDDPVAAYFMGPYRRPDAVVSPVLTYLDNDFFKDTSLLMEVETQKQNNVQAYKHIWLGEYDERGDARVLQNYRIGYADGEPIDMPPLYGLDHGFNDPTALIKIVPYPGNRLFIADERIVRRCSLDLLPELLGSFLHNPESVVYADRSRPDIIDLLQRSGFPNVIRAPGGSRAEIAAGVEKLQTFELIIAPHCENFYAECHAYSFPANPLTGIVVSGENPLGGFDHGLDACRYALSDYAPTPKGGAEESAIDRILRNRGGVYRVNLWPSHRYDSPYPFH